MTNAEISYQRATIRAGFLASREMIASLPDNGEVLFFSEHALAVRFNADGKPAIVGLGLATIREPGHDWPSIRNGHGNDAIPFPMSVAKACALIDIDRAIAAIS